MIAYKEIEQGSEEWHAIKWGKIGGTLSKGLFVKSDTLLIEILSQLLESFDFIESFTSDAMDRGNELEPEAREYLNQYTGLKFEQYGWLQSEENELLGISPDGMTSDETKACEIKCFGRKKHLEVLLSQEIPLDYISQCIHYFTVNPKLEKLYFIAYRPEAPKHFIKELTRESILNFGTKAKTNSLTIQTASELALKEANTLLTKINEKTKQLNGF